MKYALITIGAIIIISEIVSIYLQYYQTMVIADYLSETINEKLHLHDTYYIIRGFDYTCLLNIFLGITLIFLSFKIKNSP